MEKLDQEKFDTLKELAVIHQKVSDGRSELLKLKEATDEHMVIREEEVKGRILRVLKESREVLENINTNHNELTGYRHELEAYAIELNSISSGIITLFEDFNGALDTENKFLDEKIEEVKELIKINKLERITIQKDRELLGGQRDEIRDGWRLLKDRQRTLKQGFEELKNKQK